MDRLPIEALFTPNEKIVSVFAWVQTIRDQGRIIFLLLRDRSGVIQAVVSKDAAEPFVIARELSVESYLRVEGSVKAESQAPGGYEIVVRSITVLSQAKSPLPIQVLEKGHNEAERQIRLDWRWLDLRKPEKTLIFRVWTTLEQAFRTYWIEQGYLEIHSPKLMSSASESGAEVFPVIYFDRRAYLAQSPQFYKQMAIAAGFERVFEIGPVFRAEPSFTSRHATEFTSYDVEIANIESEADVMRELETVIARALAAVHTTHGRAIEAAYGRQLPVPKTPFPCVTMVEAKAALAEHNVAGDPTGDFSPEEERRLGEIWRGQTGHEFVFVTDYPTTARPFYHMRHADDPKLTKSFDLFWNGIEITTGAQREHRSAILEHQAIEKGIAPQSIEHYLNFFRYGCPPHGGYGLGPNRLLMKLFDLDNVRETMYLYRGIKRLTP